MFLSQPTPPHRCTCSSDLATHTSDDTSRAASAIWETQERRSAGCSNPLMSRWDRTGAESNHIKQPWGSTHTPSDRVFACWPMSHAQGAAAATMHSPRWRARALVAVRAHPHYRAFGRVRALVAVRAHPHYRAFGRVRALVAVRAHPHYRAFGRVARPLKPSCTSRPRRQLRGRARRMRRRRRPASS